MVILAIESSCDETAVAVLEGDGEIPRVLSSVISSQVDLHAEFGGVVPEIAARAHVELLAGLVEKAMLEAGADIDDISHVAVTRGPGLKGCLLVGFSFAKALAWKRGIPLALINHLEGHLFAQEISEKQLTPLPFICFLVSGGHTELVKVNSFGHYEVLARTLDDAAGEAFDKCAKLLGLPYPGGPCISEEGAKGNPNAFSFPIAMPGEPSSFSFSGIKTAIALARKELGEAIDGPTLSDFCASVEKSIVDNLILKAVYHLRKGDILKALVLGGGVAANGLFRKEAKRIAEGFNIPLVMPSFDLCTDNAVMIGHVAHKALKEKSPLSKVGVCGKEIPLNIEVLPRFPISSLV